MEWGKVLGIGVDLFRLILKWAGANQESQERFFETVEALEKQGLVSVKLRESAKSQLERLREMKKNDGVEE